MSQEDYAASLFTSSILGLILLPCLYFLKRSCSKGSKCSLITWLSLTLLLSLLLSNSISDLLNAEESKVPFDPYEILSVSPLSSEKEIRSSFRELSKKFHPDKNPDHKDYYLKITKAYETLTDAKAKHNYETYGNPDGPSVFKISFGLPGFLFKQENQLLILLAFLVLVVVVPCSIVLFMRSSGKNDIHGCSQENYQIFFALLNDNVNLNQIFYMISACCEFRELRISREEEKELNSMKELMGYFPRGKEAAPQMIKVVFLLAARMENRELSKDLYNEQQRIVKVTLKLLKSLADAAFLLGHLQKSRRINLPTFELIAEISRCLVTGVPMPFDWINFVDGLKDYKLYKDLKTINQIKAKIISKDWEKKVGKEEISKILDKIQEFPEYELKVSSQEPAYLGQTSDLIFEVNRKMKEESKFDLNFVKEEYFWIFGLIDKKVIFVKSFQAATNVKETAKVMVDKKLGFKTGDNTFTFLLKSDSFLGVETLCTMQLNVLGISKKSE